MGPDSPLGSRDLSLESLLRSLPLSPNHPAASRMNSAQAHPAPSAGRSRATRATADTARPRPVRRLPGQLSDDPHALVVVRGARYPTRPEKLARPSQTPAPEPPFSRRARPHRLTCQSPPPAPPSKRSPFTSPLPTRSCAQTPPVRLPRLPHAKTHGMSALPLRTPAWLRLRRPPTPPTCGASPSTPRSACPGHPIHRVENQARRQRLPQPVGDCTVTAGRTSSPSRAGRQPGRQRRRQRVRQRCGATCASPKLGRDTPPTPNANRNTARSPSESTTVSVYQVDASVTVGVPATIRAAG